MIKNKVKVKSVGQYHVKGSSFQIDKVFWKKGGTRKRSQWRNYVYKMVNGKKKLFTHFKYEDNKEDNENIILRKIHKKQSRRTKEKKYTGAHSEKKEEVKNYFVKIHLKISYPSSRKYFDLEGHWIIETNDTDKSDDISKTQDRMRIVIRDFFGTGGIPVLMESNGEFGTVEEDVLGPEEAEIKYAHSKNGQWRHIPSSFFNV